MPKSFFHHCPEARSTTLFSASSVTHCPLFALAGRPEVKGARAKFVAGMAVLRRTPRDADYRPCRSTRSVSSANSNRLNPISNSKARAALRNTIPDIYILLCETCVSSWKLLGQFIVGPQKVHDMERVFVYLGTT